MLDDASLDQQPIDNVVVNEPKIQTLAKSESNPGIRFCDIIEASCEKDSVLFSVRSSIVSADGKMLENHIIVGRYHEDFVWLHDILAESDEYAGNMIPPVPDKPDFSDVKSKLNKLMELENSIDPERYKKMKGDVDEIYLLKFKKSINNHTYFLKSVSDNQMFARDQNVIIFLSFEGSLDVRGKNKRELFSDFLRTLASGADRLLRIGQKEPDDFFNQERIFLEEYSERINESKRLTTELITNMEETNSALLQSHAALDGLRPFEKDEFAQLIEGMSLMFEDVRKVENRIIYNVDLKLNDTFR